MPSLRLHFKCTLTTTSSIPREPIQPKNKFQVTVCVQFSPFLAPVLDRYDEETGSNLKTNLTEKNSFFISYKRDGSIFYHWIFVICTSLGFLQKFY